ncbi:MAG: hypothetical protein D6713_00850 [Deltaproteobacteria bacterium]|nr:MAG: hypothetical protein D6713_00850 [Deltaproteobacteria bacterium]
MRNLEEVVLEVAARRKLPPADVWRAVEEAAGRAFPTADVEVVKGMLVRYLTAGRGASLEEAREAAPSACPGDVVPVPLRLEGGARRRFRWLLNRVLSELETERLYRKWKREKGRAVMGAVMGPMPGGRGVYVDLGDAVGELEKQRMVPGESYTPGRVMVFLVAAVKLRLETGGRLEVVLSRNSRRLAEALIEQSCPGVKVEVVRRVAGRRCVVVSGSPLSRKVMADVSRLLGEVVVCRVEEERDG